MCGVCLHNASFFERLKFNIELELANAKWIVRSSFLINGWSSNPPTPPHLSLSLSLFLSLSLSLSSSLSLSLSLFLPYSKPRRCPVSYLLTPCVLFLLLLSNFIPISLTATFPSMMSSKSVHQDDIVRSSCDEVHLA